MHSHLLIVDGLNVVRRVYEANLAPDSQAKAEGAARSSLQSIRRALSEASPTHAVVFFDAGGSTWRHALYGAYRQNRSPMPEVLREVLPSLRETLQATLNLQSRSYPGIEADDAIAQLALQWRNEFPESAVTVLSTDKDMAQLVAHGVRVRDHFIGVWRDEPWIEAKFGVPSALLGDLLALMGDAADGVPGVRGVGAKTAARWLNTYQSLEAVLAAAPTMTGKIGERLRDGCADALLSRALVGFKTDSPLGLLWADLAMRPLRA